MRIVLDLLIRFPPFSTVGGGAQNVYFANGIYGTVWQVNNCDNLLRFTLAPDRGIGRDIGLLLAIQIEALLG
jgi:hypothetical protein